MSMGGGGAAPADGTAKASLSVHPPNPPFKPLSHPKTPGKNAKNAAPPTPRSAGPAPTSTT